jgi:hypothetical protein
MTGSDVDSMERVKTILEEAFGMSVRTLPPRPGNVLALEDAQTTVDWEWSHAAILMGVLHWSWAMYIACR